MGLFLRPRRPVMRLAAGAATAGVAYRAGQRRQQQDVYNEQAQQAPPPPPPAPAPTPAPAAPEQGLGELDRLAQMHASGTLTDAEFTAAKAKLLGL